MPRYVEDIPRNNVYTGMLGIALLVMIAVGAVMYFDWDAMGKPPAGKLNVDVPGAGSGPATSKVAP